MFTLAEEQILSVAVKKYPALYDKRLKDYKDNVVNNNAWCEVANECDFLDDGNYNYYNIYF